MQQRHWKAKIIGTAVIALVAAIGYFGVARGALAQYLDVGKIVIVDGVVASTTDDSLTLLTTSTDPITVQITDRTVFAGNGSLDSLEPGDQVKVTGRSNNQQVSAQVVQPRGGTGYGTSGDPVMALNGKVIAKTDSSFTVRTETTDITFQVNGSTRFFPGNLNSLKVGDQLLVMGQDSASGFMAQFVLIQRGNHGQNNGNNNSHNNGNQHDWDKDHQSNNQQDQSNHTDKNDKDN